MPIADHGGFGLSFELGGDYLVSSSGITELSSPPGSTSVVSAFRLNFLPSIKFVVSDGYLDIPRMQLVFRGTMEIELDVQDILLNGSWQKVAEHLRRKKITAPEEIRANLIPLGNDLTLDFTVGPVSSWSPDADEIASHPAITVVLAEVILANPDDYQPRRDEIASRITSVARYLVDRQREALGAGKTRWTMPVSGLSMTSLRIAGSRDPQDVSRESVHLLYDACGLTGNATMVTRPSRSASDVAALVINNSAVLRCLAGPSVTAALGLTPGGFIGHPFFWVGNLPLALSGGNPAPIDRVSLRGAVLAMDGAGLRLTTLVDGTDALRAARVRWTIITTFTLSSSISGGVLTLTMTPAGSTVVARRVTLDYWVYIGSLLYGGLAATIYLLTVDTAAMDAVGSAIAAGVGGLLSTITNTVTLPGSLQASVRAQSVSQADAGTRMVSVSQPAFEFFLPESGFTFADSFPAHDWIINLQPAP